MLFNMFSRQGVTLVCILLVATTPHSTVGGRMFGKWNKKKLTIASFANFQTVVAVLLIVSKGFM